jgi:predicted  nucleic acid-binding Zn-ribbon protein
MMSSGDLVARVEVLEKKMTALDELPARVSSLETQIVQLRTEMKGEFSAVRQEMRALNDHTLTQVRILHEEVIDRIARLDESGGARRSNGRRKRR